MIKYFLFFILLLAVFSCKDKKRTFLLPLDKEIQEVVISVLKTEITKNNSSVFYNKLICYDRNKEYPVRCWEKDSFPNTIDVTIRKPFNPFGIPNYLSVNYLKFNIERNLGITLNTNDTLYFRAQIDSCFSKIIDFKKMDSIRIADGKTSNELIRNYKCITILSKPVFNPERNIAFIRVSYKMRSTGGGIWILMQKRKNEWIKIKEGNYWNAD